MLEVFIFVQYVSWKSMIAPMTAYNSGRGGSKGGLWGLKTPLQKYIKEAKRTMYWYKNTLKCISWNKCHFNTLCNKTAYIFQGVAPATTPPTPYLVK